MRVMIRTGVEAEVKRAFSTFMVRYGGDRTLVLAELDSTIANNNADVWESELKEEVEIIPTWEIGLVLPKIDSPCKFNGIIYRALKPHIVSNPTWTPDVTLSEYRPAPVIDAGRLFPRWNSIGLLDGVNFWRMAAIVDWNNQYWLSGNATNVWEPGVSQWTVYNI